MNKISKKIKKDYRKNIKIKDVQFYRNGTWDTLIIKIIDENKKHFKNKTLTLEFFYEEKNNLQFYVEAVIDDYIDNRIGSKIREIEAFQIVQEYKRELMKSEE